MSEEVTQAERDRWQAAAFNFLQGKRPAEIIEMFRVFKIVLEDTGPTFDAFSEAVHDFAETDESMGLEIGQLFLDDPDPNIRLEAYWFFEPWLFRNPTAGLAICETMLSDVDSGVVSETIVRLTDTLHDAGRRQPLESLVYVSECLQKAKRALDVQA